MSPLLSEKRCSLRPISSASRRFARRLFRTADEPPINKALFAAWSVGLARRSEDNIDRLVRNREKVEEKFTSLLKDDKEFETAISYATGTPKRVQKQFQAIDKLIEECV